jgi:hypothetical protein
VDEFQDVAVFDELRRFYAEAYDEDVRLTRSPRLLGADRPQVASDREPAGRSVDLAQLDGLDAAVPGSEALYFLKYERRDQSGRVV